MSKELIHKLAISYICNTGKLSSATTHEDFLNLYKDALKEFNHLINPVSTKTITVHKSGLMSKGI